jgi:hypothetical protein
MLTLTLLPRAAVGTLLALKISCGAGQDKGGDTLTGSSSEFESTGAGSTIAEMPTTSTADPSDASTGPATATATGTEGTAATSLGSSGAESTGDLTTFGESTGTDGGGMLPDGECQSDADCDADLFEQCFNADENPCGPCQADEMQCLADRDCGEGVCELIPIACGCNGPINHVCVAKCEGPADCEEGDVCDVETGHCGPVSCTESGTCPPLFECVPDSGGDDCVRLPCDVDAQCDDGACVEGKCFEGYGLCMPQGA